jgi:flagellin
LTLNGVAVGASLSGSDSLSSAEKASSAIAKVAAINAVAEQSGVFATVGKTTVAGSVAAGAAAADDGVVTVNGVDTATFYMSGNKEIDRETVSKAINDISERTGVRAINTHDDNQGVTLVSEDGRNITLGAPSGTATYAHMGLADAGTYVGSFELNTKDGSAITVGSSVLNVQSGQKVSGLNFGTYEADKAQVVTTGRSSTGIVAPTDATSGVLNGTTLVINGVGISAAIGADDTASYEGSLAPSSTKASSAIAIAAAINKSSEMTGVTAKADANVVAGTGFSHGVVTAVQLNGVAITATIGANSTREDVLSLFNDRSGETGVVAEAYGDGVKLTAADGRNIAIAVTGAGGAAALGLTGVDVGAAGAAKTHYASVQLTSDKAFTVDSGSEGDNKNFKALGFTQGTFGGANSGVKVAEVDVSTMEGATTAIKAIDAAIQTIGEDQAKAGAFQNRLDAVVSNLTESTQNMSASRSRILDTDYATETTNLARSQIISQAATAMLAQANQSAQSVLSLLK